MDGWDERVRDLQQRLHQLDREAHGSALTTGESDKNRGQRQAVLDEPATLRIVQAEAEQPWRMSTGAVPTPCRPYHPASHDR